MDEFKEAESKISIPDKLRDYLHSMHEQVVPTSDSLGYLSNVRETVENSMKMMKESMQQVTKTLPKNDAIKSLEEEVQKVCDEYLRLQLEMEEVRREHAETKKSFNEVLEYVKQTKQEMSDKCRILKTNYKFLSQVSGLEILIEDEPETDIEGNILFGIKFTSFDTVIDLGYYPIEKKFILLNIKPEKPTNFKDLQGHFAVAQDVPGFLVAMRKFFKIRQNIRNRNN